jgi:hypothetical protein
MLYQFEKYYIICVLSASAYKKIPRREAEDAAKDNFVVITTDWDASGYIN